MIFAQTWSSSVNMTQDAAFKEDAKRPQRGGKEHVFQRLLSVLLLVVEKVFKK